MRKLLVLLITLQLMVIPSMAFAEDGSSATQTEKRLTSELLTEQPSKQLEGKTLSTNPGDYMHVDPGSFIDTLYDEYDTYHDLYFEGISDYDSETMDFYLTYYSEYGYMKEPLITLEFFKEENGVLEFLGNTNFDTYGGTSYSLNSYIPKSEFANETTIYVRLGVSESESDPYYSDLAMFKVDNPFYTGSPGGGTGTGELDTYAVISNESTDTTVRQSTGSFQVNNQEYSLNEALSEDAYQLDLNKEFDVKANKDKLFTGDLVATQASFAVGDYKSFWVTNFTTYSDYQISARLAYSGTKANVWVYNNQITNADAAKLGQEFDQNIHPSVTSNFGPESDVNQDGKINILTFDIQDGFSGYGGYIGGYFYGGDLAAVTHSNQSEIFYIDTYPSMGTGSTKDVTQAYETIAHEFQHMVNFNQSVLIEGQEDMDVWLNEALSMAAEQVYTGQGLTSRVDYYNYSDSITSGHSLLNWEYNGDTLANYSLSYLFGQYLKLQAGVGNRIFKEILQDPSNDYRAVENVAKKYIDPTMTFGQLMTDFRAALLLKQDSGAYGFKGDPFFDQIQTSLYTGGSLSLVGGGAVVKAVSSSSGLMAPGNKGQDVTYSFFNMETGEEVDSDLPDLQPLIGSTRYSTAVEVSKEGWSSASTAILVNGSAIADGLTATPLAAAYDAPILLTKNNEIPAETMAEMVRLGVNRVILIGGTSVISDGVSSSLRANGYAVSRIGGTNRYETSLKIAKELDQLVDVNTTFLAYGYGEPDALSIAAQAGTVMQPIILTDKGNVPANTYDWLRTESLETSYFIGGTTVIQPSVMTSMQSITAQDIMANRLSGENRQDTNAKVIDYFYNEASMPTIMVAHASTAKLVDALSAGPLAAKYNVPVLLVSGSLSDSQKNVIAPFQSERVHQIGGGVESAVINQVVQLMN